MNKNIAIIFAGGSGARMGAGLPKQFIEINGKPIIIQVLELFEFHDEISSIYVACKEDYISKLKKYIRNFNIEKIAEIVPGGTTGQDSIYNALKAAAAENPEDDTLVLISDGVRPFITNEVISANIKAARENGAAVTCVPMFETPVISEHGVYLEKMVERDTFYTAQAPQTFFLKDILEAHEKMRAVNPLYEGVVDSAGLMYMKGNENLSISIVNGNRGNIKITTPEDLYLARGMVEYRETMQIFGFADDEIGKNLKK